MIKKKIHLIIYLFFYLKKKKDFVYPNINDSYSFIVLDDSLILIIVFLSKAPRVLQNSQRDNIESALQTVKRPSKPNVSQHDTASYAEIPHNDTGKDTLEHTNLGMCVHAYNVNNENSFINRELCDFSLI